VQNSARRTKITVSADGTGLVSQAGVLLLAETLRVTGLGEGLAGALARWRAPRTVHDPGKILADLALALALGGDCLADVAVLRAQPQLAGPVASDPVVSRLVAALAAEGPRALRAIRTARGVARERAWALAGERCPGADGSLIPVDIDATIVIAHSEKEKAAPTWKKTYGLLTELPELFSQFRGWLLPGTVTVPDHDQTRRSSSGYGEPRRAAGWFPSGHGRSVGSVSAGRSLG
jgi:Transposase DDE domain group 1